MDLLVNADAVTSGAAAKGAAWQYYPLGNGDFCTNPFYAACPHRMACARCEFHLPAESQVATALQAKEVWGGKTSREVRSAMLYAMLDVLRARRGDIDRIWAILDPSRCPVRRSRCSRSSPTNNTSRGRIELIRGSAK